MNTEWQSFLEQAEAVIADGRVSHFGDPARELQALDSGNILADVSHTGLIAVRGADAAAFLQGQLTNDIRQVSVQHSQLSAYCSPKGRVLACMRIFMRDDIYYLGLPREILDATLKRLRLFVLRAKVTLDDASDTLIRIGYAGPQTEATLRAVLDAVPAIIDEVRHNRTLTLLRIRGPQPRFEIIGDAADITKLWTALRVFATPAGADVWDLLDIRAGLPSVYATTCDAFVPQMINLQALGGISFTKGCYTGQEIVARMHYLGTLKRRMYLAHITTDTAPQPGNALYASGTEQTQSIGSIVAARPAPQGGFTTLAVVEIKSAATAPVHLHNAAGPLLEFMELPYALE